MQTSRVNCIARIRPLLEQEQDSDRSITVDTDDATIMLRNTNRGNGRYIRKYKMSKALDKVDQTHMFEQVLPLLQDAIAGYNTSIFCYGQTGTGKTYTMLGYGK